MPARCISVWFYTFATTPGFCALDLQAKRQSNAHSMGGLAAFGLGSACLTRGRSQCWPGSRVMKNGRYRNPGGLPTGAKTKGDKVGSVADRTARLGEKSGKAAK